jgi:hypothetical protein
MAIQRKNEYRKQVIDIDGPDGNAFVLLGICKNLAKQLEIEWSPISKEAMSSDYKHLLNTLQKYFGEVVDFETTDENLLK